LDKETKITKDATDAKSESDGIQHFFSKAEKRQILRIWSGWIQNFCFGPTLQLFS